MAALRRFAAQRAAGDVRAALRAASDACHAAPNRPEAHYAYRRGLVAIGEPATRRAGLRRRPPTAPRGRRLDQLRPRPLPSGRDRGRQDGDAPALCSAPPGHPAATANLGAFMRITGEARGGRGPAARRSRPRPAQCRRAAQPRRRAAAGGAAGRGARAARGRAGAARRPAALRALASAASAGAARSSAGRPRRGRRSRRWPRSARSRRNSRRSGIGGACCWRWPRATAAPRTTRPRGWRRRSRHGAGGVFRNTRSWRITISPNSGPGRRPRARPFAHGAPAMRCCADASRSRATTGARFVDANIAAFDRARASPTARAPRNDDPAPVFIVGMPRSGTTLAEQILAAHAQAHGAGERSALGRAFAAPRRRRRRRSGARASPRWMRRRWTRRPRAISRSCTRSRRTRRASSTRCPAIISISAWSG